jgi:delta-aminolevulinic acid dehydratase/porphobilinogen synthase
MLKAAFEKGFLDYDMAVLETLISIKRTGADLIVPHRAKEFVEHLLEFFKIFFMLTSKPG